MMEEVNEVNEGQDRAKETTGGVTDAQIRAWKNQYRKVYQIEVQDDDDLFVGYFKRPSLETISAVNKIAKTDEIKSSSIMLENCWLVGDEEMKSDTLVRMAAIKQLSTIFEKVVGSLKNV